MESLRQRIVTEALEWTNTPYHDHSGLKNCGVDCAYFPCRVYQAVGRIPKEYEPPHYSPQQWLNSPKQSDRFKLRVVDTTMLEVVKQFARREITEAEALPGDFVLYKIVASWTHGGIIVRWPDYVLHPVKGRGVIGSHGVNEGFLQYLERRFFSVLEEGE